MDRMLIILAQHLGHCTFIPKQFIAGIHCESFYVLKSLLLLFRLLPDAFWYILTMAVFGVKTPACRRFDSYLEMWYYTTPNVLDLPLEASTSPIIYDQQ